MNIKLQKISRKVPRRFWPSYNFLLKTLINFYESGGFICTNSLAYTFLFAFIPFLIATASISDLLPFSDRLVNDVQFYFFSRFLPQSGNQIYNLFKLSFSHSTRLSIVGVLSLLVTTYGMMFAVEKHIHQMWYLKRQRKFMQSLLIFTTFFICGPLVTYSLAFIYDKLNTTLQFSWMGNLVADILSVIVTTLSFIFVYKFIPNKKVKWIHAVIAGVVAGVLFSIVRWAFAVYMAKLQGDYSLLYGSLATLPIFLLWIYSSCFILLYCAQIIYVVDLKHKLREKRNVKGYC